MSVHFCFNIFCSLPNYALVTLIFYGILKAVIFASPPSTPFLHSFMAFLGRNSLTFLLQSSQSKGNTFMDPLSLLPISAYSRWLWIKPSKIGIFFLLGQLFFPLFSNVLPPGVNASFL